MPVAFLRPLSVCALALLSMFANEGNPVHSGAADTPSVFLEDLTWTELSARIAAGATTVLVPIGGTEQNGPHMVLGKHNVRVRAVAGQIAHALGHTMVAPVLAYVPEGSVSPPTAHMRFTGTISIPDAAFESVLEGAARSFRQHGFRDVVFLGDHGGYQKNEVRVATKLNREWSSDRATRVHALAQYYQVTQTEFVHALKGRGYSSAEIGTHAGLADTSLAMAVNPALVRSDVLAPGKRLGAAEGVYGDPRRSNAEAGRVGLQQIIDASVLAIRAAIQSH